ncbi:condensation domain-containing protein [Streptomyces sp. AM 4-1-1]|uniref:condensation domain-containing protein n=1 Tax=Streptomyces sp. AM 4-1-1 TaxID=3028710 RepID=UPI0023B9B4FD|nr:condensation domain-containing protein [Streptomyces sp. AM 4-1-1]WEH34003.1 condensation domain-containing protein [Streptomyces sp. AM 4-1-1]
MAEAGPATAARLAVGFHGERSGRAPLTWGQRAIWHAVLRTAPNDHYFNIGRVLPLADRGRPATATEAAQALADLMGRHESLRTRLSSSGGDLAQELSASGTLSVTVVDAAGPEAAERTAGELLDRLSATRFDYAGEWPLRAALVTSGGRVTHAVLVLCHLAADGHGVEVLVRDLRLLVRRGSAGRPPTTTPLELAREQHGETGRRRGAAALAHWESGYRAAPPTMFPQPVAEPRSPRFWTGRIESTALNRAVGAVAAAHRVSGSTVLLAACAALVAAGAGHRTAAVMPIVGNRTAAAHRDLVSTLSQDGLFLLELGLAAPEDGPMDIARLPGREQVPGVAGESALGQETGARIPGEADGLRPFTDLLPGAYRAALRTYRSAGYDPVEWDALGARMRDERGTEVHPYCCFNDMRLVERPAPSGPPPTRDELRGAMRSTRFGFPATQELVACRYCLHITEVGPALAVALTADTAYLPPDTIRAHLYAMERLIVASAVGDAPRLADLPGLLTEAHFPDSPEERRSGPSRSGEARS